MDRAAKAAQALARMLDAFYRALVALIMGLLGLVGISPKATGGGLARAVAEQVSDVVEEPRAELGEAVKERTLQMRGMAPSETLIPLPAAVEDWLMGLSPADLATLTTMPSSMVEQHVTSGANGQLRSLGFVLPTAPAPARPVADTPSRTAAVAVEAAHHFDIEHLIEQLVPAPTLRPR
ncbi:hypothetical protein [Methylobacterium sp. Leaf112]|uniref:hypothetical protein n=1 Tax=Methylobacterium sp. Leaf112 TaxID=1736258 RepID=UPI0006FA09B6|nr:hypothetical protein [Methylobacterium sp. Leaf112]KQP62143.1 hypothetical protein ASF52_05655 [Methylobacterium sp. Leaf112]